MSEDIMIDPDQFKVCMVKKTKHYYKEIGFWSGIVVLGLLVSIGIVFGIQYLSGIFKIDNIVMILVFVIYATLMLGITYVITKDSSHFITMFIRNFIALHGLIIAFVGTITITMICLSAIPIELAIICAKLFFDITGNFDIMFFGGIAVFVVTVPLNVAAFQCFKIEEYMDKCFLTSMDWIKI